MHTHACLDPLIERSRFPCVHTYLQKETKARLHSTKTWWKSASSSIGGGARLFSFVAFALAPPLLRFSHSRKRERERKTTTTFSRFFYIAHRVQKSCPPVRSIERRASSKSSRPTCFFSLERNDKRTTPRAICRRRACFRARADIGRRWSKRLRPASKGILHFRDTGLFKILNRKSVASSLEGAHFSQRPSFLSPRDEKKQVR